MSLNCRVHSFCFVATREERACSFTSFLEKSVTDIVRPDPSLYDRSDRFVIVRSTVRVPSLYSVGWFRLHPGSRHEPESLEGVGEEDYK